jgi:hypothetical protein
MSAPTLGVVRGHAARSTAARSPVSVMQATLTKITLSDSRNAPRRVRLKG